MLRKVKACGNFAKLKSVELLQDGVGAKEGTADRVNQVIDF